MLGCLPRSLGTLCIPLHPWLRKEASGKEILLHSAWVRLGEGGKDAAPREQGRHWAEGAETQFLSAGDGEGSSQTPPTLCGERVGKGEHLRHLQMEPRAQGSPDGSAVKGTRRRRGGSLASLWGGGQMLP